MRRRILYLSRVYPNNVIEVNGLWVEGLVREMSKRHDVRVVAPVPYCPPFLTFGEYVDNRKVLHKQTLNGIEIDRPRFLSPPGYLLHGYLGESYYWSIKSYIDKVRKEFPFDLIHAHFSYPDAYVAARLAEKYQVPMVFTEHAAWIPWMNDFPRVREKALYAVNHSSGVIAGSRYLRDTVMHFVDDPDKLNLIPVGVDTELFRPDSSVVKNRNQIVYVGRIHRTKGIDYLLDALASIVKGRPEIKLLMVGGSLGYRDYRIQEQQLRQKAHDLGLDPFIEYVGMQQHDKVVELIRASAVLVLPSRRESFGSVLAESIACGTPVVATRCGGPEDIVSDEVGMLVDKEDVSALADGISRVLDEQDKYEQNALHSYAQSKFSWKHVAEQTNDLYNRVLTCEKTL